MRGRNFRTGAHTPLPGHGRANRRQALRIRPELLGAVAAAAVMGPMTSASAQTQSEESEAEAGTLEQIVITGSRVARDSFNTALPVLVLGRGRLMDDGVPTISDVVKNLTINTGSNFNADFSTQRQSAGTSQVNLRGLTIGSTLTLVNGRRVTLTATSNDDGATFVDINQFPLLMVERIEVLKDGGSAIYGSDAVAGVFNIITRKGFDGVEFQVHGQTTTEDQQRDFTASFALGDTGERHEFAFYFDYFNRSDLRGPERDFFPTLPDSTFNTTGLAHVPTLIFSEPPTEGPFAGSGLTGFVMDPDCGVDESFPAPFVSGADPASGANGFCRAGFGPAFDLVFEEERFIGFSEGSYQLADDLRFFGEMSFAFNKSLSTQSRAGPILRESILVESEHPANPHGVDVVLFGRVEKPTRSERPIENNYFRIASGFEYDIAENWNAEFSVVHSRHDFSVDSSVTNLDALTVDSDNPEIPRAVRPDFNPFGSRFTGEGPTNDPAVLDEILGTAINLADSNITTAELSFAGDFGDSLRLPGGRIGAAFGAQFRRDFLEINNDDAIERGVTGFDGQAGDTPPTDRRVYAGFAEVNLPVLDTLEIQAALRHESFEGAVGSTTDPKVGIQWQPHESVALRGAFSTAFRAPTLFQSSVTAQTTLPVAFDPFNNDPTSTCDVTNAGIIFPASIATGNQDLQPEDAESYSAGVVVQPTADIDFSVDYWRFEVDDIIVKTNLQATLNNDCLDDGIANDPRVARGPGGAVRSVDTPFVNAASLETDGIDFGFSYDIDAGDIGQLLLDFRSTWTRTYDFRQVRGGEEVEGDGNRNFTNPFAPTPKWRSNFLIDWTRGMHSANVIFRHISGFDDDNNNGERIEDHLTVDLQYTLALERFWEASRGTSVTLGSINLFDNQPPAAVGVFGFETKVHDPRGRLIYFRVSQQF